MRYRVPGGGFAPAGRLHRVGADADGPVGKIGLICQDNSAIDLAALIDFAREAVGKGTPGLDIAARVVRMKAGLSAASKSTWRFSRTISRGAHLGSLTCLPLTDQIGAETGLLEWAERIRDDELAEWQTGRLSIKLYQIGGHSFDTPRSPRIAAKT